MRVYRASLWGSAGSKRSRPPSLLVNVQVVRANGHWLTLRAPTASGWQSDADFDDKVRLMEQWRLQYGPLAAPRP